MGYSGGPYVIAVFTSGRGRQRENRRGSVRGSQCLLLPVRVEGGDTGEATQVTCRKLGKVRKWVLPEACIRNTAVLTPASDKVSYRAVR